MCVCVCVCVNYVNYYVNIVLLCKYCILNKCSLRFKIYSMYCDVVNVQPHFNFSDEIIKSS